MNPLTKSPRNQLGDGKTRLLRRFFRKLLGTTLLLPVYRSTTPIPAGMQLLVPGYLPSTQLPAGEWIYLPARRSAAVLDELPEQGF
jgi:hypothetical protein